MVIAVYIDHNVWGYLLEHKIDLADALPKDEFRLGITREANFEVPPTPPDKKAFIEATIAKCEIETDTFFGFNAPSLPQKEQRVGGFDIGRFASAEEISFIASQSKALKPTKKPSTKLYPNEADISLAARSFHSVVLTFDNKKGPLRDAYEQGGKLIFLTDFDKSGMCAISSTAWSPSSTLKLGGNLGRRVGRPTQYHDRDGLGLQADADPVCRAYDVQLHEIGGAVRIALFERLQNPLVFLNGFPEPGMPSKRHLLRFKDGLAVHVVDLLE